MPPVDGVADDAADRGVHRRRPLGRGDGAEDQEAFHEGDRLLGLWEPDGLWHPCCFVAWKGRDPRPKVMWEDGSVSLLRAGQVRRRTQGEQEAEGRRAERARAARRRAREAGAAGEAGAASDAAAAGEAPPKRARSAPDAAAAAPSEGGGRGPGGGGGALAPPRAPELAPRHRMPAHRFVLAPMVGGSELPFRMLARQFGAQLCYTPMMYSDPFSKDAAYRESVEHGFHTCPGDRPLAAHFCGNDPEVLLAAAKHVADRVDAVDLNLGCPQRVAHAGHFGSYLLDEDDRPLLLSVVKRLAEGLPVPVFCKIRLLDTPSATVRLVRQLEASGAALIAVHARYRGTPTHRRDGPAHLDQVPALKRAVRIPVLANGNVRSWSDVVANLESTGADGVMSAEGMLDDPCLFAPGGGSSPSSCGPSGAAQLRKLEKKLRQVEALEQKAATGATLSREEADKVASRKALRRERKLLLGGSLEVAQGGGTGGTPAGAGGRAVPRDGLQKARLYLEMCVRHQMPVLPTVLFHVRRMAKGELTQYQLMDELKASPNLEAARKVLALAEGYRDRPGTFVHDEEKAQRARELQAKRAYEEACRRKYEQRMERKASKLGVPLASLLKPTKVPGGQLKGAPDPSWLQENEAAAE